MQMKCGLLHLILLLSFCRLVIQSDMTIFGKRCTKNLRWLLNLKTGQTRLDFILTRTQIIRAMASNFNSHTIGAFKEYTVTCSVSAHFKFMSTVKPPREVINLKKYTRH